jgi:Ion channel
MKRRSRLFAVFYLVLIPTYAALYTNLPYHFYHTTILHEQSIQSDAERLAVDLQDAIISNFQAYYHSLTVTRDSSTIDISSVRVLHVSIKADQLHFYIYSTETRSHPSWMSSSGASLVSLAHSIDSPHDDGTQMFWLRSHEPKDPNRHLDLRDICPFRQGYTGGGFAANTDLPYGFIVLPFTVRQRIDAFRAASAGFPSAASGSFPRMLYFSAITITTVGYGDILPITPLARALVASEAVIGVVLIGLFLNALANESANSNVRRSQALIHLQLGKAYKLLAVSGSASSVEALDHWRQAQTEFQQSLDIYRELKAKGALVGSEPARIDELATEIANCDSALKKTP